MPDTRAGVPSPPSYACRWAPPAAGPPATIDLDACWEADGSLGLWWGGLAAIVAGQRRPPDGLRAPRGGVLGADGLRRLAAALPALTALEVGIRPEAGDDALAAVAALTALTALRLRRPPGPPTLPCTALTALGGLVALGLHGGRYDAAIDLLATGHGCPQLTRLELYDVALAAPRLAGLSALRGLRELALGACDAAPDGPLDDAGAARLATLTGLEGLLLDGCAALGNAGARALARLACLRRLTLLRAPWLTDVGVERLLRLPHLVALGVEGAALTPACLRRAMPPMLRELALGQMALSGAARPSAPPPPLGLPLPLTHLALDGLQVVPGTLAGIAELGALTHLALRGSAGLGRDAVACWARLTELRVLDLTDRVDGDDAALLGLTALVGLTRLGLSGWRGLTGSGLAGISTLTGLQGLELAGCRDLQEWCFEDVAWAASLRALDLGGCLQLGGGAADDLPYLTALTALTAACPRPDGWRWGRACAELPHLARLDVHVRAVADAGGLLDLAALSHLTTLRLDGAAGAPRFARALTQLGGLRELRLGSSLGHAACVDATLELLAGLPHLASFTVVGGELTDAGVAQLAGSVTLRDVTLAHLPHITAAGPRALLELPDLGRLHVHGCDGVVAAELAPLRRAGMAVACTPAAAADALAP